MREILVYGAYGYSGSLIVGRLCELGIRPIIAGRDESKLLNLARGRDLDHRVFDLDTPSTVDACLDGVGVVLHCAGPFARTARPMVDACLRTRTNYLDITGEVGVFEAIASRSEEARQLGVMLMPGVGFDVVPSDCLAVHLARSLPNPAVLRLAILGVGSRISQGTARTMAENLHRGGLIRSHGRLESIRTGSLTRRFDYGRGPRLSFAVPWGDLSTAWHSTRIPRIETYFAAGVGQVLGAKLIGRIPWLLGSQPVQRFLKSRIDQRLSGPTDDERERGRAIIVGEVEDSAGRKIQARLETPESYKLTAHAAAHIARLVSAGRLSVGYQTPAMVYGPDLILELDGTRRLELN